MPKKEEKKTEEKDERVDATELLSQVVKAVDKISQDVGALTRRVDEIQPAPKEPPSAGKPDPSQISEKGDIIKSVEEVLGMDFKVSTEKMADGDSFKLIIIPPPQLKEHKDDKRIKVIPYLEGAPAAKEYAMIVKNFCVEWAARNGRVYQWPLSHE